MPKHSTTLLLFIATLITTTLSGAEWITGRSFLLDYDSMGWKEFKDGFWYSIPFLGVLTVHEFGHYFVAKWHRVKVTLPTYIPFWWGIMTSIGTMGAFIRIKDKINSRIQFFDIGLAGPLAGFLVSIPLLWYGFSHLPPPTYIFTIHPEYVKYGFDYPNYYPKTEVGAIVLGDNLLFNFFKTYVADPARLPHPYEMTHYPVLLAGYLSLFFTALNLLPIGQLDGGHILHGLIGNKAFRIVSPLIFITLLAFCGLGAFKKQDFDTLNNREFGEQVLWFLGYVFFISQACSRITASRSNNLIIALAIVAFQLVFSYFFPQIEGYTGLLIFLFVVGRILGIYHPETQDDAPLNLTRKLLGWFALVVFIICFSPQPFIFV